MEKYPNERPGLRYRRVLGESLSRELQRFVGAHPNVPIGEVGVAFNARDGEQLASMPIAEAVHSLQFNVHCVEDDNWEMACEALVFAREVTR